ncbi:hypothetical protein CRUP_012535 [Coryphaenoides rupestris]|nr:hypothetical protein CRUP_012535 [Coryphaenoides rupestris]
MFICNGTICLAGAGLLGLGIWLKVDQGSLTALLGNVDEDVVNSVDLLSNISYVLIGVGALKCCGFNNYTDFGINTVYPVQCCNSSFICDATEAAISGHPVI